MLDTINSATKNINNQASIQTTKNINNQASEKINTLEDQTLEQVNTLQGQASKKINTLKDQTLEQVNTLQGQASEKINTLKDQTLGQVNALKEKASTLVPKMTVTDFLKNKFELNDEQLEALSKADPSILQQAFWESLDEKKWPLFTSALALIPFFGQDVLALKSAWNEANEVLKKTKQKIVEQLPSITEKSIANARDSMLLQQGGSHSKKSNAILMRIEKSKKMFHNTNKTKKMQKIRKTQKRRMKQARR